MKKLNEINLKALRILNGYDQQKMGEFLGLSQAGYGKKESKKTEFTISELEKLTTLFETDFKTMIEIIKR